MYVWLAMSLLLTQHWQNTHTPLYQREVEGFSWLLYFNLWMFSWHWLQQCVLLRSMLRQQLPAWRTQGDAQVLQKSNPVFILKVIHMSLMSPDWIIQAKFSCLHLWRAKVTDQLYVSWAAPHFGHKTVLFALDFGNYRFNSAAVSCGLMSSFPKSLALFQETLAENICTVASSSLHTFLWSWCDDAHIGALCVNSQHNFWLTTFGIRESCQAIWELEDKGNLESG